MSESSHCRAQYHKIILASLIQSDTGRCWSKFLWASRAEAPLLWYYMYKLSWKKTGKAENWTFLNNNSANQVSSDDSKSANNRHVWFGYITSSRKVFNGHWFPHSKILIDCKYCVGIWTKWFWNMCSRSNSATNELNFKIVCNCIQLNAFIL